MSESRPNSSALIGQTAAGYVILKEIGAGAASVVYQAMEPAANNKLVAIKVLDRAERALVGGASADNPLEREAWISQRFSDPGILRIFGSGELPDGRFYMAMEYVEGMTLAEELRHRGKIPWLEAVDICEAVAWSLSPVHDVGIVHRDLKPGNVMVRMGKGGHICTKLIDFGCARLPGERDQDLQTLVGTPHYMAPEQAAGRGASIASDVYALGAMLYEMLTGKSHLGLKRPTPEACMEYLTLDRPVPAVPVQALAPDVPEQVADFVLGPLSRQMSERPVNAFAFAHELADAAEAAHEEAQRSDSTMGRLRQKLGTLLKGGSS